MSDVVYRLVTERIIGLLEQGTVPWRRPWIGGRGPQNHVSGRRYRGINVFYLNAVAEHKSYRHNRWLTYRQAKAAGGYVRKGESGYPVIFWKIVKKTKEDDAGEPVVKTYPLLRYYTVFNIDQCGKISHREKPALPEAHFKPARRAEAIIRKMPCPPTIEHGGYGASYNPLTDTVRLPERTKFYASHYYYSTAFHELAHATGHPQRLGRFGAGSAPEAFGRPSYSKEELIAEMGAAYLCAAAGIENQTLEDSASYIQGWLGRLRGDHRLLVSAGAKAQKAADHILGNL